MRQKENKMNKRFTLIIAILVIVGISSEIFAQRRQQEETPAPVEETAENMPQPEGESFFTNFIPKFKPRAGLYFSPVIPAGVVGNATSFGIGGGLYGDVKLPIPVVDAILSALNIELRGGLYLGYTSFSGTMDFENTLGDTVPYKTNASTLPIILYAKGGFPLKALGIMPFATIGTGITLSSAQRTVEEDSAHLVQESERDLSESSADGTFCFTLGTTYGHSSIPFIEFMFQTRYMAAVQKASGHFIQFDLAAAYTFELPKAKPEDELGAGEMGQIDMAPQETGRRRR